MFVCPGEPLPEGGVAIKGDPSPNGLLVRGLEKCRYILTVCPLGGLLLQTLPAGLFLALFPLHLGLSFRRRSAFLSPGNLSMDSPRQLSDRDRGRCCVGIGIEGKGRLMGPACDVSLQSGDTFAVSAASEHTAFEAEAGQTLRPVSRFPPNLRVDTTP